MTKDEHKKITARIKAAITRKKRSMVAGMCTTTEMARHRLDLRVLESNLTAHIRLLEVAPRADRAPVTPARTTDELTRENEVLRDALQWLFNESTHYLHTSTKSQSIERAITNARQVLAR